MCIVNAYAILLSVGMKFDISCFWGYSCIRNVFQEIFLILNEMKWNVLYFKLIRVSREKSMNTTLGIISFDHDNIIKN